MTQRRERFTDTGFVRAGKMMIRHRQRFEKWLEKIDEAEVLISVQTNRTGETGPSQEQRGYYHAVVIPMIAEEMGEDEAIVKELMTMKFFPHYVVEARHVGRIEGEYVIGVSTEDLFPAEYAKFGDRVRQFAAEELGVNIPDPDPFWWSRQVDK